MSFLMPVYLMAIAEATIEPMKYEVLKKEVNIARSLGYPNSPIKEDPEMMQATIPNPSIIRAKMYMPTVDVRYWYEEQFLTYHLGRNLG
jgi:hypothetical protein